MIKKGRLSGDFWDFSLLLKDSRKTVSWAHSYPDVMPMTAAISYDHGGGGVTEDKGDKQTKAEQNDRKMFVLHAAVDPLR